tara:strand:- start:300 stop:1559 length:1260 start_codon:yes stop_codon:yes gene_type:complete
MSNETAPDAAPAVRYQPAVAVRSKDDVPFRLRRAFALDDFEGRARRHLPAPVFGYIAGAAETGRSFAANRLDFGAIGLVPRSLRGHVHRNQETTLFGKAHARPFGIAPMGFSALAAYDGDVVLARAAHARGTLAIMSATSLTALERVAEEAESRWFQAYFPGDMARVEAMTDRIARAGFETLVVTVDVPVNGNRETDRHNGFATPLKPTPRLAWQGMTRPAWLCGTAFKTLRRLGMPHFENLDVDRGPPILARNLLRSFSGREQLRWEHVQAARDRWKGNFVLKGVLSPQDVARAREMGCDGIIVSNHGGRQLDGAISPMAALPGVLQEAGEMTVMLDSGVRRGTDVLKALALGAQFVFVGRPMLYAAALGGAAGVRYAIDLLSAEIDRDMALLGIGDLSEMTRDFLVLPEALDRRPTP